VVRPDGLAVGEGDPVSSCRVSFPALVHVFISFFFVPLDLAVAEVVEERGEGWEMVCWSSGLAQPSALEREQIEDLRLGRRTDVRRGSGMSVPST
jgi:hypothetical protein